MVGAHGAVDGRLLAAELVAIVAPLATPRPGGSVAAKNQVAHRAGAKNKPGQAIADAFLSIAASCGGSRVAKLLATSAVDLDSLDTEALVVQDWQEAALLAAHSVPAEPPPADPEGMRPPSAPKTGRPRQ